MKISRTPLRISFLGGGSDYPQWFNEHGGAILGTTINKYCYVMLHNGKSWKTFDLPTKSGLGSSSAYTVGLLRVCTELDKETIAGLATVWEQDKMADNVGCQDQYLCSSGGFHVLRFTEHAINDTLLSPELVAPLQKYLMLFDTQQYRRASTVINYQLERIKQNRKILERIAGMVDDGVHDINNHDYDSFGALLNEAWSLKRQLSKYVSTLGIDGIYEKALRAGATGGKLLGGGGGGFILFLVMPDKQAEVRSALNELAYAPFDFENEGTQLVYDNCGKPK